MADRNGDDPNQKETETMAIEPVQEYEFVCAACREEITVNEEMKTALMDHGCVVCGELPSEDAFTPL